MQRIIKYGLERGVGVWLYLNDVAGTRYPIEETLAQYEQWGASGVKYGFMELHQGRTTRKDNNQEVPSTATAEIARTMITWSGATVIPDIPEYYRKYPELLEFLSAEKQPWKESRTLAGEIGEYIVMMRQNADGDFLVAAATDESSRAVSIPLSFLPRGKWTATVNTDGANADYRTNREATHTQTMEVNNTTTLRVLMAPGGGACILIKKQ